MPKNWLEWLIFGFFFAIVAAIVYVKAGKNSGQSGGQQTAAIVSAGGTATAQVANALEGN